ncbi:hypothetical protein DVH24_002082, partial [Malus domestica]
AFGLARIHGPSTRACSGSLASQHLTSSLRQSSLGVGKKVQEPRVGAGNQGSGRKRGGTGRAFEIFRSGRFLKYRNHGFPCPQPIEFDCHSHSVDQVSLVVCTASSPSLHHPDNTTAQATSIFLICHLSLTSLSPSRFDIPGTRLTEPSHLSSRFNYPSSQFVTSPSPSRVRRPFPSSRRMRFRSCRFTPRRSAIYSLLLPPSLSTTSSPSSFSIQLRSSAAMATVLDSSVVP